MKPGVPRKPFCGQGVWGCSAGLVAKFEVGGWELWTTGEDKILWVLGRY